MSDLFMYFIFASGALFGWFAGFAMGSAQERDHAIRTVHRLYDEIEALRAGK